MKNNKQELMKFSYLLRGLYSHISPHRRFQFRLMILLTLISSIAEVISLGAAVPFIGILTEPERVFNSSLIKSLINNFGINSPSDLIIPLSILFAIAALIAGALRVLLLWFSIKLSNAIGTDLSAEVYGRTLYQRYSTHVARNSSEVISGITQKVVTVIGVLNAIVTIVTSIVLFFAIVSVLFFINPIIATFTILCFGISYCTISWFTKKRLKENSRSIAQHQTVVVKTLQEGLGAIRDILLDGTQNIYCADYRKSVVKLRQATGENQFITLAPRFIMEALAMVLIAIFAVISLAYMQNANGSALPILGALALGAQRLMPLLQQLYGNWSLVAGSQTELSDVLILLDQPIYRDQIAVESKELPFENKIIFNNVSYQYDSNGPPIIQGINFQIKKGQRIGLIGATGSGKSTILDLLMGLLPVSEGSITIDGKVLNEETTALWQRKIAHVPQSIYLSDATISENIAFGVPVELIDIENVKMSAKNAQIRDYIESIPSNYSSLVGERGARISGGQLQRIGIARALYKQANVLIFDEATSALDSETELSVMHAIDRLDRSLTILMVAHRETTLLGCDCIYQLEKGRIIFSGTYKELLARTDSKL